MRQIPSSLTASFKQNYNVRPIILLEVRWSNGTRIYSTQEVESDLGTVYPFVKEFSNFDALSRVDGFGSTNSITVTFFDQTGKFKEYFDTLDVYDTISRVHLSSFGTDEHVLLFEGKFGTPITYDPDNHTLTVVIQSEDRNKQLCYSPSIDDIDESDPNYAKFEQLLNDSAWPDVFGIQAKMEIKPLVRDLELEVAEDLQAAYFLFSHTYVMKVRGELLETLPSGDYVFNIDGTLIDGTLDSDAGTITFDNDEVTNYWYADKFPIQVERLETIELDGKIRATRVRMINIAEPPWLVGMYVGLTTHLLYADAVSQDAFPYTRITDQTKYAPTDDYETVLTLPLVFIGDITYLTFAAVKNKFPKTFTEGSKIIVHNWNKKGIYVVDNKYYSDLNDLDLTLWFNNGDRDIKFPAFTYDKYSTNGNDANKLWIGALEPHPPCTYVQFKPEVFGRMITNGYKTNGSDFKDSNLDTAVLANVTTAYNTDSLAIENILSRHSSLGFISDDLPATCNFALTSEEDLTTIIPEIAWQKNKAVRETIEDDSFKLELINLNDLGDPIFSFTAKNIHSDPINLYFTPKEDIKTVFKVTIKKNDDSLDLIKYLKKNNTDLYGITDPFVIDYYTYNGLPEAKTNIAYWVNKLSTPYLQAEFTGYLDAIALEVLDVVYIDFGTINFYDPDKGLPYNNSAELYGNNLIVSGNAIIREMNIDIQTGLIKFKVEFLDKIIGNL